MTSIGVAMSPPHAQVWVGWGEVMTEDGTVGTGVNPGFHESEAVFGERVASLRHPAPRLPGTLTNF